MKHRMWTESAVLQGFDPDGRTGIIARAQRFPASGHDWLWIGVFTRKRIYGFVEEHLQSTRSVTRVDGPDVSYQVGKQGAQGAGTFQREGPRATPGGALAFTYGKGHAGPRMREGVGEEDLSASAALTPAHSPGSSLENRVETIGTVVGRLGVRGKNYDFGGFGLWHERHSFEPRFEQPFSRLCLVGEGGGIVAVRTPTGASGFVSRGDESTKIAKFEIGAVAEQRPVRIETEVGDVFEFVATDVHRYTLPIEKTRRKSSVVTAVVEGMAVVGTVDDWKDDEFLPEL